MRKKRRKGKTIQFLEYSLACSIFLVSQVLPWNALHIISSFLGTLLYTFSSKRRNLAINNIRNALDARDEKEIKDIALKSCKSFFLTFLEIAKIRSLLTRPDAIYKLREMVDDMDRLFLKAKKIHEESGGCIFVTPHLGNWEILPYISTVLGVPLTVVMRPLDNVYLERLLNREASGQIIIPKKNALFLLKRALRGGRSVGMLPDQSTMKGISIGFFGRKATTTPIPAILAISCRRPIVVVSCCRRSDGQHFDGFVSEPIWPDNLRGQKDEIFRLTNEMTHMMEIAIKKYPEQYLWIHNRWKVYRGKREFLSD